MDHPGCNEGEGSDQSWISRARRLISASLPLRSDKSTPAVSQWTDGITFSCCGAARYTFHISRARMNSERSPRFFLSLPLPAPESTPGRFFLSVAPLSRSLALASACGLGRRREAPLSPKRCLKEKLHPPPPSSGDTTLPHFAVIVAGDDRCVKIISRAPVCRRRFFRAALRPGDPRPPDLRVTFASLRRNSARSSIEQSRHRLLKLLLRLRFRALRRNGRMTWRWNYTGKLSRAALPDGKYVP